MRNLRTILSVFALAAFCASVSFAQAVSASIVGTVTDASSRPSSRSAKVTITEMNTSVAHTVTDE